MASITLKNVNKTYDDENVIVPCVNLTIKDKEFIILVGPSGCGKSTTLRMIAGLEEITSGELYIGDRLVNDVRSKDREIAMVFQNYALYPHMTVYQNMAFGLELRKVDKEKVDNKVREVAEILDIEHLLNRKPKALSGGQRQRVALGRAMVRDPEVFLLDEPLSNLDAKLRGTMRSEIRKLHGRLNSTFIYVTHDQVEAMTMADRIVVMKDGIIQQVDTPQRLYDYPANHFVAGFIGAPQMNMLEVVIDYIDGNYVAKFGEQLLLLPGKFSNTLLENHLGKTLTLGIRPEDLKVQENKAYHYNKLQCRVEFAEPMGAEVHINVSCDEVSITARIMSRSTARTGDYLILDVDMSNVHLFDMDSTVSILADAAV